MRRRAFLALGVAAGAQQPDRASGKTGAEGTTTGPSREAASSAPSGTIHTVRGPIPAASLGTTLVHEHVLVDFGGATAGRSRYDPEQVFRTVLPHLQELVKR